MKRKSITSMILAPLVVAFALGGVWPMPAVAATSEEALVHSFDEPASEWNDVVGGGEARMASVQGGTQGDAALRMDYSVAAGSAQASIQGKPWAPMAYAGLKVDLQGDGTYNTAYLRLRDASGEFLVYRIGNLNDAAWRTYTVNLMSGPAGHWGGNNNAVLDHPVRLDMVYVDRNGSQPATGRIHLDNLRAVSFGWGVVQSTSSNLNLATGDVVPLQITPGSAGDFTIDLRDRTGNVRSLAGRADGPGPRTMTWNGLSNEGTAMIGTISAILRHDTKANGLLDGSIATVGSPSILTVRAGQTVALEEFNDPAEGWTGIAYGGGESIQASTGFGGGQSLRVDYDVAVGNAEVQPRREKVWPAEALRTLRLDIKGDGTYNTLYLRLRDASGEQFTYWVGNLNSKEWRTTAVSLHDPRVPVSHRGGNNNGVLDLPLSLDRISVARNGNQPPGGYVFVDNLRGAGDGWSGLTSSRDYLDSRTDESATIGFVAQTPGDYRIVLSDTLGRTRTLLGRIKNVGRQSVSWNGLDDRSQEMYGPIDAVLEYDTTMDGTFQNVPVAVGSSPLLLAGAGDELIVEDFEAPSEWTRFSGSAAPTSASGPTQGAGAVRLEYDLAASDAGIRPSTTPPPMPNLPLKTLKIDYRGDGTWNTLYLRVRDSTGEYFYYRVDTLDDVGWASKIIDLSSDPAASWGGNDDAVLDFPLTMNQLSVVRNGDQPPSGYVEVDNLRVVSDGWTLPSADVPRISTHAGGDAELTFTAGTSGDYTLELQDYQGRTWRTRGTSREPGEISHRWNGKTGDGEYFEGLVSATLTYDNVADGQLGEEAMLAANPRLMSVADFEGKTGDWSIAGVNSGLTVARSSVETDQEARLISQANIRYIREEFDWNRLEPFQGWHDWPVFDRMVDVSDSYGLEVIGKLGYSANWSTSAPPDVTGSDRLLYAPRDVEEYRDYVHAVVSRYHDKVDVWEVWNEPNSSDWWRTGPSSVEYADLLAATYDTIKEIDPDATVLVGGMAGFSSKFMNSLVSKGAGDSFDGVAFHTFVDGGPESGGYRMFVDQAKNWVAQNKPDASLWITEMGWQTCRQCTTAVDEPTQAHYLERAYLSAAQDGIAGAAWFNLKDLGEASAPGSGSYGVLRQNGNPKPAYASLKEVAGVLKGSIYAGELRPTDGLTASVVSGFDNHSQPSPTALEGRGAIGRRITTDSIAGAASRVEYSLPANSRGFELRLPTRVAGTPNALSFWTKGDPHNLSFFLKFKDASGESFEAEVGKQSGAEWTRHELYFDGLNPNLTHYGGNGDKVIDYPIDMVSIHAYKTTSEALSGQIIFDELKAYEGAVTRGIVLQNQSGMIAAVHGQDGATAWIPQPVPTGGYGKTEVRLSRDPVYVYSRPKFQTSDAVQRPILWWLSADGSTPRIDVVDESNTVVRRLVEGKRFGFWTSAVGWDGKDQAGQPAPNGSYWIRISATDGSGRSTSQRHQFQHQN